MLLYTYASHNSPHALRTCIKIRLSPYCITQTAGKYFIILYPILFLPQYHHTHLGIYKFAQFYQIHTITCLYITISVVSNLTHSNITASFPRKKQPEDCFYVISYGFLDTDTARFLPHEAIPVCPAISTEKTDHAAIFARAAHNHSAPPAESAQFPILL